ncbi:DUF1559 family PulG-like putative transporter [Lignipirellula cremea]|uniref:DUF1559 domain-containing protein n=1 Tax=Lignipirellula cremea TaxID=2528010 RepID=A0A518DU25_9BACT|nr:DUF1559 domain-containing protein [Lignipirellula cremea]QDU95335.1 hypothetical protein Pla8534_31500 [Lignipirellula cremea]
MAIEFTCPHCGHHTSATEAYAGSSGPCANCGELVTLPGVRAELASPGRSPVAPGKRIGCFWIVFLAIGAIGLAALLSPPSCRRGGPSARSRCSNNLKQIGLGLHGYYDAYQAFPPAYITDENGKPMHSWRVLILPYMELSAVHAKYDFDEPWDGPNNRRVMSELIPEGLPVFRCPSQHGDKNMTSYHVVVGPGTAWKANEGLTVQEIADGTRNSIAVIEAPQHQRHWLDPTPLALADALPPVEQEPGQAADPRQPHGNGRNAVYFDGSTRFLYSDMPPEMLRRMILINDGEEIDWDY